MLVKQLIGTIKSVNEQNVIADLNDGSSECFLLDEIHPHDMHLLQPGAKFYWTHLHETTSGGQLKSIWEIRMKR